jgi:hypothetical protein
LLGFAEKLDNFGQSRRRLGIAQDHSAFEIGIVAFRVDHARLEAAFDDVLDEPVRCGRFAAAGCAGDQQAAALRMQPGRFALQVVRDLDGLTLYRVGAISERSVSRIRRTVSATPARRAARPSRSRRPP